MNPTYDIFISYSRADIKFVKRLEEELKSIGISCWIDYKDIPLGDRFVDVTTSSIKEIAENAKLFICVLSSNVQEGSMVEKEVSFAVSNGAKFILPVVIDNANIPKRLSFLLAPYNRVYLNNKEDLSDLLDSIQTILGRNVWVFVSHSNKDFGKIIKLRNKLESYSYRPLLFFLKCLDDDQEIFELIKREINARDRFLLCNSRNAGESKWVQKEIEYIKSLNRPYEIIDIDAEENEIDAAIRRFDRRATVYIWSTDSLINHIVADELMKKSFRVSLLSMDFFQNVSLQQKLTDAYVLLLISRELTESEVDAIEIRAKQICRYICPIVISKEAFANRELYNELKNADGIETKIFLLQAPIENSPILSFDTNEQRAQAIVKYFMELDCYVHAPEGCLPF